MSLTLTLSVQGGTKKPKPFTTAVLYCNAKCREQRSGETVNLDSESELHVCVGVLQWARRRRRWTRPMWTRASCSWRSACWCSRAACRRRPSRVDVTVCTVHRPSVTGHLTTVTSHRRRYHQLVPPPVLQGVYNAWKYWKCPGIQGISCSLVSPRRYLFLRRPVGLITCKQGPDLQNILR